MLSSSPSSAAVFPVDLTGLYLLAGKGDQFAYWLTHLGEPWLCLPLLFLGRRLLKLEAGLSWLRIGIFALVLLVVVQGLKFGIDRPRPGAVLEEVAMLPGGDLKARAMPRIQCDRCVYFAVLGGLLWRQRRSFLRLLWESVCPSRSAGVESPSLPIGQATSSLVFSSVLCSP